MKVININKDTLLADKAEIANTFLKRLVGLLNRKSLHKGQALILLPCNCIHSFFMRFIIDVIFLDKTGKVIGVLSSFKPFRFSPLFFRASCAVELPEGTIASNQTTVGDLVTIEK